MHREHQNKRAGSSSFLKNPTVGLSGAKNTDGRSGFRWCLIRTYDPSIVTGRSSSVGSSMVPGKNSEAMDHLCALDLVNYILVNGLVNINSKKGVDRLQNSKKGSTGSDVGIGECWKTSRY